MKRIKTYVTNEEKLEPEDVGFFNGGQKTVLLDDCCQRPGLSALRSARCGFRSTFGRVAVAIGYVLHDVAALLMLVGFIVHIYESTAQQPGTFQAMTRGTVSKRWAWTHHPAWYRERPAAIRAKTTSARSLA